MLTGTITIGKIDYEKSFRALFPILMEKLESMEDKNLAVRFLIKMGEESVTAVVGILNKMEGKQEMFCQLINSYASEIVSKINEFLEKDEVGKHIQIAGLKLIQNGSDMILKVERVDIDYKELVESPAIQEKINQAAGEKTRGLGNIFQKAAEKNAGRLASATVKVLSNDLEKIGLNILQLEEVKRKILMTAEQGMEEKGIFLELVDFMLEESENSVEEITALEQKEENFVLNDFEEKVLDAVTTYLKELIAK